MLWIRQDKKVLSKDQWNITQNELSDPSQWQHRKKIFCC